MIVTYNCRNIFIVQATEQIFNKNTVILKIEFSLNLSI
jgi:hypothetical protein